MPQYTKNCAGRRYFLGTQQELLLGAIAIKDHFKPEDVVVVLFHDSGRLCREDV
jgi:hypothetical protein